MDEAGFVLVLNIAVGIEILLYAVCMAAFFYPFMTSRKEQENSRFKKVLMVFLLYMSVYFVSMLTSGFGWLYMAIVLALLVAVSGFLDMDRGFAFFLGVLFFCIRNLSMLIVRTVSYFLDKHREYMAGLNGNLENVFLHATWSYILALALRIVMVFAMLCAVGHLLRKKTLKLHWKELCCLLLLPIIGILFANIIVNILLIVYEGQTFQLYEEFPAFIGIVPVVAVLFYAGILLTIASYQKMAGLQEEQQKHFVEQQQVHAIQERMEEVDQFYDGIRRMKHEMRNHLTNIKGLVRNGSYEEMEDYIDRMDESMNVFELTVKTGNAVTDVIINDKQKRAEKQGIPFVSEFSYPRSDGYNAYDIGIIVNNLLQNAMEACEKMTEGEKYIYLSGRQQKKFYLIHVKNSFEGEVTFDEETNLPRSTKEKDTSLHGIGLSNVKREVEKYMGDVDIRVKKNEFRVTVLLQEKREKH
ncbi:MAG: GHKL domain-containing protein [Lachnospiraceae bacterium]|nr:GHKL domain-containing protein [Lachnospiraceae bacterium]